MPRVLALRDPLAADQQPRPSLREEYLTARRLRTNPTSPLPMMKR
ncbi:hypothetical protein [Nocardia amamiensis]|nr:hypothetical protein [Nocardia amamiensis]